MWLDEIAAKIATCTTEAELVELTGSPDITKALGWFKNGALADLNAMLADAMQRVKEGGSDEQGEGVEAQAAKMDDGDEIPF